jgi:hypothetical protein
MWTIHLVSCMGVVVDGVTVDNDLTMANTDALDITSTSSISCQVSVPILKAQLFERSVQLTMVTWRNGGWRRHRRQRFDDG